MANQELAPNEIIIVDGSQDNETQAMILDESMLEVRYFRVNQEHKGLTNQRNYGLQQINEMAEVICFLDDDVVLSADYFLQLINTYKLHPEALGVGGYITNNITWQKVSQDFKPKFNQFYFDGYVRADSLRFIIRKFLGLSPDRPPGFLPEFSHGRSLSFLPPSQKIYAVEILMGGVSSFKKAVFETHQFSKFFKGYGLYEDAEFCLRVSKNGPLYLNTKAQLEHHHHPSGRPNFYLYGKMVVTNGWYVWRVKNDQPSIIAKTKWHSITLLLMLLRGLNVFGKNKKGALAEFFGRLVAYLTLWLKKPK